MFNLDEYSIDFILLKNIVQLTIRLLFVTGA